MYHIENQERLYFHSKIDELNQLIKKLQESYLYAEVQHYKELVHSKRQQIEHLNKEIEVNRVSEEELLKDRNRFKEWKEKLEHQVNDLHHQLLTKDQIVQEKVGTIHEIEQKLLQTETERKSLELSLSKLDKESESVRHQLHQKEELLDEKIMSIHQLEKLLLQSENELKSLSLSMSKLQESHDKSTSENNTLMNENQTLLQSNQSLNTKVQSQQQHINDLNAALSHSEDTKKEMFYNLITKTEELEKLLSERKHTLDSLQFAKDQLVEAEKQKMLYIKTFISEYQKHFEENEWWFSSQFADIDLRSKQQEERIDAIEQGQEIHFLHQNEALIEKFQEVEERFIEFIEEVDLIRDHNSRMTHNLFELKRMVENQKRSQTHIIKPRLKASSDKMVTRSDENTRE
ncbi:hypothetical protein HF072_20115 [Bacillus sp. RO3]|nr:hypothetical protein [Bacillus sp. RO3]